MQDGRKRLEEYHNQCKRNATSRKKRQRNQNRRTKECLSQLDRLQEKRYNQASNVPLADPNKPKPTKTVITYFENLLSQMRKDAKTYKHVKEQMDKFPEDIFRVSDLPPEVDPNKFYPTATELHQQRAFGKNNCLKLYNVTPNLANIAVILWKSGFLEHKNKNRKQKASEEQTLAQALPSGTEVFKKVKKLSRTDFSALQLLPLDFHVEADTCSEKVRKQKRILRETALIKQHGPQRSTKILWWKIDRRTKKDGPNPTDHLPHPSGKGAVRTRCRTYRWSAQSISRSN